MRTRLLSPTILILLSTSLLIACGTSSVEQPTHTAFSEETPAATASARPSDFTRDTPALIPQTDIPTEYYPPDTRVDVPVLDDIIEAVVTGDAERVQNLIHFTTMGCTHALGMGGPPKCLEEEAEGALVEGLPFLGHEGWVWRREEMNAIVQSILAQQPRLYAVYRKTDETIKDSEWLPAQYGIVFGYPPEDYVHALLVDAVGVVRMYSGESPADLSRFFAGEYILPPRE